MSYCATATPHDATGKGLLTLRYGAMPGCDPDEEIVAALEHDVVTLLARRPELKVGLLCDGAAEMWNLLHGRLTEERLATSLRELVDRWHPLQKVGTALRTRYDEADGDAPRRRTHRSEARRVIAMGITPVTEQPGFILTMRSSTLPRRASLTTRPEPAESLSRHSVAEGSRNRLGVESLPSIFNSVRLGGNTASAAAA